MWILPILLLAAAAAAQEEEERPPERPRPPRRLPPPGPQLGMAMRQMTDAEHRELEREAMALLGEGEPKEMTDLDDLFADGMTIIDYPPHPWTHQQVMSFREGRLICPLGHSGPFHYLRMTVHAAPLVMQQPGHYVTRSKEDAAWWELGSALVWCDHSGHDEPEVEGSTTQVFWFPFDYGMGIS